MNSIKYKVCKFLIEHGYGNLAYRISASLTGIIYMQIYADGFRNGIESAERKEE